jgi:hypothetical protein
MANLAAGLPLADFIGALSLPSARVLVPLTRHHHLRPTLTRPLAVAMLAAGGGEGVAEGDAPVQDLAAALKVPRELFQLIMVDVGFPREFSSGQGLFLNGSVPNAETSVLSVRWLETRNVGKRRGHGSKAYCEGSRLLCRAQNAVRSPGRASRSTSVPGVCPAVAALVTVSSSSSSVHPSWSKAHVPSQT